MASVNAQLKAAVHAKWPQPEQKEWWYTKFTEARRRKLVWLEQRQGGRCAYCRCDVMIGLGSDKRATLDHKVPMSLGGTENFSNLCVACDGCNSLKGDLPWDLWQKIYTDETRLLALHRSRRKRVKVVHEARIEARERKMIQLAWLFYHFPQLSREASRLLGEF
jgi:hypothetical protein